MERYLKRLDSELRDVPAARRGDIRSEVHERITAALTDSEGTDMEIRQVLMQMGPPSDVAVQARERFGILPPQGGIREAAAIGFLLLGGLVLPVLGWFVGVTLLWLSQVWTFRDKMIGTFVVPGGLALPSFLAFFAVSVGGRSCINVREPGGSVVERCDPTTGLTAFGAAVVVLLAAAAIWTAAYLWRRMRRAA